MSAPFPLGDLRLSWEPSELALLLAQLVKAGLQVISGKWLGHRGQVRDGPSQEQSRSPRTTGTGQGGGTIACFVRRAGSPTTVAGPPISQTQLRAPSLSPSLRGNVSGQELPLNLLLSPRAQ